MSRVATILAAAVLIAGCVMHYHGSHFARGCDDAYISYRYARNLAEGHGLVFNVGERVEGYSNFLYTLLMVPVLAAGLDVYRTSAVLNVLALLAGLFIYRAWLKERFDEGRVAMGLLLFALTPALWLWAASGLETTLVLTVQLAMWWLASGGEESRDGRRLLLLALAVAVSVLLRADGFVVPTILVATLAFRGQWRRAAWCAGAMLAVVLPYFLWRHGYYGYWLPNTFYCKVADTPMHRVAAVLPLFGNVLSEQGLIAPVAVFVVSVGAAFTNVLRRRETLRGALRIEHGLFGGLVAYWLYIGGDIWKERFLLLLFALGAAMMLRWTRRPSLKRLRLPLVLVLAAFQMMPLVTDWRHEYIMDRHDMWLTLGGWLARNHTDATLAIDGAGKTPFVSRLPTIDMLGLTDEHIAHSEAFWHVPGHNKWDPDYVLRRSPTIIAAWTLPSVFPDLCFGLTYDRYHRAGYRLRYLVDVLPRSRGRDVIDVGHADRSVIDRLIADDYNYAVLMREPE